MGPPPATSQVLQYVPNIIIAIVVLVIWVVIWGPRMLISSEDALRRGHNYVRLLKMETELAASAAYCSSPEGRTDIAYDVK
jgi:hypothetical protein